MKIYYKGFNYSQDGPGNRLVYHLQGCNFRCKWCSNPESMPPNSPECQDRSLLELAKEVQRSRMMFFDGGGVTLTGGEPTLQFAEVQEFLHRLKADGIHTAIETNGSHPQLMELLPEVDFLIMDFKHYDQAIHRKWTGVDNTITKENLKNILKMGRQVLVRIPVINGFNNNPYDFAAYLQNLDTSSAKFEFLAYHEFGKKKWISPYEIENGFVTKQDMELFETVFRSCGLQTVKM